jgi:hypothetical protein
LLLSHHQEISEGKVYATNEDADQLNFIEDIGVVLVLIAVNLIR